MSVAFFQFFFFILFIIFWLVFARFQSDKTSTSTIFSKLCLELNWLPSSSIRLPLSLKKKLTLHFYLCLPISLFFLFHFSFFILMMDLVSCSRFAAWMYMHLVIASFQEDSTPGAIHYITTQYRLSLHHYTVETVTTSLYSRDCHYITTQ